MADPTAPFPTGLWRRRSMIYADGRSDMTTRVFWLQTQSIFADIRVPADRLPMPAEAGLSDSALLDLARAKGFAGWLEVDGTICRWHRELDFEPPGGAPDEAFFEIADDRLTETGMHGDYVEIWDRVTPETAPLAAFRREGEAGYMVLAGDYFIEIGGRACSLPAADSLVTLVREALAAGDRVGAAGMVDMRICFGSIAAGSATPWRISLSTAPWLEGTSLLGPVLPHFEPETGVLTASAGRWKLMDSTLPVGAIARHFGWSP